MQKILIIGCGLMGFSLAKALRNKLQKIDIAVFDSNREVVDIALSSNIVNKYHDIAESGENFDLVVISSPLSTYKDIFDKISRNITKCLIIDLGSLNDYPLSISNPDIESRFISCHPITGSEKSGIENSSSDLFEGKDFIVSGKLGTKNKSTLEGLTQAIGSNIKFLDSKEHDKIFALTSHLPQFLSFLSTDISPKTREGDSLHPAFRLNASNPVIWSDIFEINSKNIEKYYSEFFENLCDLMDLIDSGNYKAVYDGLFNYPGSTSEAFDITDLNKSDTAKALFRLIIVLSYVKIKDIAAYKQYSGSGFNDFVSITSLFKNIDVDYFSKILKECRGQIIKYFDEISS